jgi:hypothetical protein
MGATIVVVEGSHDCSLCHDFVDIHPNLVVAIIFLALMSLALMSLALMSLALMSLALMSLALIFLPPIFIFPIFLAPNILIPPNHTIILFPPQALRIIPRTPSNITMPTPIINRHLSTKKAKTAPTQATHMIAPIFQPDTTLQQPQ